MRNRPEKQTDRPVGKLRRVIPVKGVDVLTDVLEGLGLRSRLFCRSRLRAPWGLRFERGGLAHFHWIEGGACWLAGPGAGQALAAGDLVVLPHGDGYTLSDAPGGTAVEAAWGEDDGRCRLLTQGGRGPVTSMLCGSFRISGEGAPLLALLPRVLVVRGGAEIESLMRALAAEAERAEPGWETVITRLMDVLFVRVIRWWLRDQPAEGHWLAALNDGPVRAALALMHERPEHRWTVQELGRKVGLSRTPFAARFARVVGETPLAYLAGLRMRRAARALRVERVPLSEAARVAGYGSEIAFGKAFRRILGVTPGAYRAGARSQNPKIVKGRPDNANLVDL